MSTVEMTWNGTVLRVVLNRPDVRNAMSRDMVRELLAALATAQQQNARVVVLQGAGRHFCSGGDITDMAAARGLPPQGGDPIAELNASFGHLALAWSRASMPVVAAVKGAVMGGGFGLACTADVVIAADTATFRLPETSLGLLPAQIAPFLLERLGYSETKRLALTGATISAAEALEIGLVHEVVPAGELDDRVQATVDQILRGAPGALAATKALLFRLNPAISAGVIEAAAADFARAARGDEAAEGMAAFLEKRAASWVP